MKNLLIKEITALFAISFVLVNMVLAQENCKVLLDSIAGQYNGECKKGLAEGQGTSKGINMYVGEFKKGLPNGTGKYTWANGTVYDGQFKNGLKEGKSVLTIHMPDGRERVQTGYWKKDAYIGEYENPYVVTSRTSGILSVRITPIENKAGEGDVLIIQIAHKGRVQPPPNFH